MSKQPIGEVEWLALVPSLFIVFFLRKVFGGMFSRFSALISSNSLEAARRLIAMRFGVCRLGMCSSFAHVMVWTYDSTQSVRILA